MLIYPLVQIDLPPYTDYASLEQKLTLAVECVSVLSRCFTFIYHIASAGRQLALVKNRGYLPYLNGLRSFQIPYPLSHSDARLPSHVSRACLQCLPRLPLVCCDSRLHDAWISLLNSRFGSVQLSYYSMSRGSLAMCNQSISSEISLGLSLYLRVPVVSFQKKASHILLGSTLALHSSDVSNDRKVVWEEVYEQHIYEAHSTCFMLVQCQYSYIPVN